jgi:hypothetical protein
LNKFLILALLVVTGCAAQITGNGKGNGNGRIHKYPPPAGMNISTATPLSPAATQGVVYRQTLAATGGVVCSTQNPYRWTIVAGTLSPLAIGLYDGIIQGTDPTAHTLSFTVRATDCGGNHFDKAFTLVINAASSPVITTTSPLANMTAGTNQNQPLACTGGTPGYTWAKTAGTLPTNCTFPATGILTCAPPTTSGTFNFTAQCTDALANPSAPMAFDVTVNCPAITITSAQAWPPATNGQAYAGFQITYTGGTGTPTYGVTGLPTGMSVDPATGLVSGTPSVSGSFIPLPSVTDSCLPTGTTATQPGDSLTVNPNSGALTLTNTNPLATCTVGVLCTIPLSAKGGTPPYTYSNPSANLPAGESITTCAGTPCITGTPTTPGTYGSITLRVTDNVAATNNGVSPYSQTILSAGSTVNTYYCNPNETTNFSSPTDGVATLPTLCTYIPLSATPSPGPTKTVCAAGCDFTTLQLAVNAAACGWIIQIKSTSDGTPTGTQLSYSGLTQLPAKACDATHWIRITTDQFSGLSAEGNRISPAWTAVPSLHIACPAPETGECGRPPYAQPTSAGRYLPQMINTATVLKCTAGGSYWRIMGLWFTSSVGATIGDLVQCTGVDHFIWDRNVFQGGNHPTWQSRDNISHGLNASKNTHLAVINNYFGEMHTTASGSNDLNLGGCSATVEGPFLVGNNFLEAADSSSSFGGCGVGAATLVPANLIWANNHTWKPLLWKTDDLSYFGIAFTVKDHIDWKNITKFLVEGNILQQTWGQQSDQPGPIAELGAKNQSSFTQGTATSSGSTITAATGSFPATMTASTCATANQCLMVFNGANYRVQTQADTTHVTVSPTPPTTSTPAAFKAFAPGVNPNATVSHGTIRYNIFRSGSRCMEMFSAPSDGGDIGLFTGNLEVHDDVCDDIDPAHWNLSGGACCAWGVALYISNSFASPNYMDQLDLHHLTLLPSLSAFSVGNGPSIGFGAQTSTTGWIGHLKFYDSISAAGLGQSLKGVCAAVGQSALLNLQCWDKISGVAQNTFCFDRNLLATTTATSGAVTGTANNPAYPTSGQSLGCGFTTAGTTLVGSYDLIQFTNLNGANGGDYTLQPTSPGHNAASDGTDLGANISLVNQYTQGVN